MAISDIGHTDIPLLEGTVEGFLDYKGRPVSKFKYGGWRSASFIIGVEVAERFAFYGIGSNLISYLTGPLGQSTATAAENVTAWFGAANLLPVLGACLADSYLGRYRTILYASLIYILGLGLLTLSAILPSLSQNIDKITSSSFPPELQTILFFISLYLVAVGLGGFKPCIQAFGADQFNGQDPEESKARSSFFNWWNFGLSAGSLTMLWIINYVQDNLNWGLGFGIPCLAMVFALLVFLIGTKTYRFSVKQEEKSAFARVGRVFVAAVRDWQTSPAAISAEEQACGSGTLSACQGSEQFKFLNRALLEDGSKENRTMSSVNEVEEAKAVLRLFPIWASSLALTIVYGQPSTFFTKQAATMDRSITSGIQIPAASLQFFISLAVVLFIPIYDRIIVPTARSLTRKPSGITMLQRIGTGMFLSAISMVTAALVEITRLKTAREYGMVDMPEVTVPMSVWWLIPQYVLCGVSDAFALVGLQEFFYDQVPSELRSVGLSLYLSIYGVGSFLTSFLVSAIEKGTGGHGRESWFSDNLNRAHLDYFYWLLSGLSAMALAAFLYFARSYIYINRRAM